MSLLPRTDGLNDIFHPVRPTPPQAPKGPVVQQPSPALAQAIKAAWSVFNHLHGGGAPAAQPAVQAQIKAGVADGSVIAYSVRNPDGQPGFTKAYVMTNEGANPTSFFIDQPTWGGPVMVGPINLP